MGEQIDLVHMWYQSRSENENSTRLTREDLSMISDALVARIDAASDAARLMYGDKLCYEAIKEFERRLYILNYKICNMARGSENGAKRMQGNKKYWSEEE